MDIQEEKEEAESRSTDGKVDPENPPPGQKLGESTSEDWTNAASNGEGCVKQAQEESSSPAINVNDMNRSVRGLQTSY